MEDHDNEDENDENEVMMAMPIIIIMGTKVIISLIWRVITMTITMMTMLMMISVKS